MAENTPRDLDWEMLALKLAIIDPKLYASFAGFHNDRYVEDQPSWIPSYVDAQKALGIYPLSGVEGGHMRAAVKKLLGFGGE